MKIKCVVAAVNANGEPDLFFCLIDCTEEQYNNGDHYDMAKEKSENAGYEPCLAYDENDSAGKAMCELFVWKSLT